jgi:hypothetical protein
VNEQCHGMLGPAVQFTIKTIVRNSGALLLISKGAVNKLAVQIKLFENDIQ